MELVRVIFRHAEAPEVGPAPTHVQMLDTSDHNRVLRRGWPGNDIRHRLLEPHPGGDFNESAPNR